MGVLKRITDEYFDKDLRGEEGKFLDIGGCRVVVPNNYDEMRFLKKADEIIKNMFVHFKKKEDVNDDDMKDCEMVEMENGYVMLFDSYDYFVENTTVVKDFNERIYKSLKKFIAYFLGGISLSSTNMHVSGIRLVGKEDIDKVVSLFKKEGVEKEINAFTMAKVYDFVECFGEKMDIKRNDVDFSDIDHSENIVMCFWDNVGNPSIYKVRYAKEAVEWWKKEFVNADGEVIKERIKKFS